MNKNNKKTEILTVRCTPEKKRRLVLKAEQLGISISDFVSDCLEDKLKRNTKRNKHKVRALVEAQEAMNQIILGLDIEQQEIKNKLINYSEGMMDLWDN